ncbi:thermonuclease family protein [Thermodesulfobacteriota bacterium]
MSETMRRLGTIILLLVSSIPFFANLSLAAQFRVTQIKSGDIIKVVDSNKEIVVRLAGIDAPEQGQPYNHRARTHLTDLILHRTVFIFEYEKGLKNSLVGEVFLEGRSINIEMLRAGLAEVFRGVPPKKLNLIQYLIIEQEARAARRGMWVLGDHYISPSVWRLRNRR